MHTVSLFGEVWGIGPATALKLYEKGHRTLDDLKNEDSLTHAQKVGLQYFDDIQKRIPRDEVCGLLICLYNYCFAFYKRLLIFYLFCKMPPEFCFLLFMKRKRLQSVVFFNLFIC